MLVNPAGLEVEVVIEPVIHPAVEGGKVDSGDLVVGYEVLTLAKSPPAALQQGTAQDSWRCSLPAQLVRPCALPCGLSVCKELPRNAGHPVHGSLAPLAVHGQLLRELMAGRNV